jgi:hypothetical protein
VQFNFHKYPFRKGSRWDSVEGLETFFFRTALFGATTLEKFGATTLESLGNDGSLWADE